MKSTLRRVPAVLPALSLAAALTVVAHCAATAATVPVGFTDAVVASGLTSPTAIALAGDGRIFAAEQGGAIRVVKNGALLATPLLQLAVKSDASTEDGLVGITLDPNFATNHYLYVYYTVPASGNISAHNRVSRFTANGDVAATSSQKILLEVPGPSSGSHNGG